MPRSRWDDPWPRYPASVPRPVEGGLATSKQRGPMAETWWSRRFTEVLESYGLGGRMQRGRRYARTGQVVSLEVRAGSIDAKVQGSRHTPYVVTIALSAPTEGQWSKVAGAMAAKVGFVARLLAGEVPPDLEDVFQSAGVALFPASWDALRTACSCPDWENPCKHIAAVLYVFADRLDADPWLLLAWRGRSRDEILAPLRGAGGSAGSGGSVPAAAGDEIAPWWPFAAGPLPEPAHGWQGAPVRGPETAPDCPHGVIDALEPLDVGIGATPFTDLLRPVYDHIVGPAADDSYLGDLEGGAAT